MKSQNTSTQFISITFILCFILGTFSPPVVSASCENFTFDQTKIAGDWYQVTNTYQSNAKLSFNAKQKVTFTAELNGARIVQTANPNVIIPISNISIPKQPKFDWFAYIDIVIKNIAEPGMYKGEVLLNLKSSNENIAKSFQCVVPITIELQPMKTIAFVNKDIAINNVRSEKNTWNRWFGSEPISSFFIELNVDDTLAVENLSFEFNLKGEQSNTFLSNEELLKSIDINKNYLQLEFKEPAQVQADKFSGNATLSGSNMQKPIKVPFTMNMKDSIWKAIIVLIFGLISGRFIQLFNNKDIKDYFELTERAEKLKNDAQGKVDANLIEALNTIIRKLKYSSFDATKLDKELDELELKIRAIIEVDKKILTALDSNRKALTDFKMLFSSTSPLSSKGYEVLNEKLKAMSLDEDGEDDEVKSFNNQTDLVTAIGADQSLREQFSVNTRAKNWINAVTGLGLKKVSQNWWLRLIVFLIILFSALLLGLQSNYMNNTVFGSEGIYDYFELFLWASGSTAVIKSVFSIK